MQTDKLRINQLSTEAYTWFLAYLNAVDTKDSAAYSSFLADDCTMQLGNSPPVQGKAAILESIESFWTMYQNLTHDLLNIYGSDHNFVLETLNHYIRHDSRAVTVNSVGCIDRNAVGLATSIRLYADNSPLFETSAA